MTTLPTQVDILIVGAGPTGLALSAELRRRGISALTIDKVAEGANTSRAAVVHARTLEVLEPLGIVSTMRQRGIELTTFRVRDRDKTLITLDFSDIPSAYNFALMCPQDITESILLARLRELGGDVIRPAEATAIHLAPDRVEAEILHDGATHTISARWVVGCDGMHSLVRAAAGITFAGDAYPQNFVLADVRMSWPIGRDEVSLFFAPDGLVVVAPLPDDRFRIVATVSDAPEHPSIDDVQRLLDTRGPSTARGQVHDVVWSSRFRVHHRIAESPRRGNVLLCGDAAHVHSPAGGQGMNTGIQDAMSLAHALAAVLGGADANRLDAWADARHEVAKEVVSLTDRMTRVATVGSPAARALRNAAIGVAAHFPFLRHAVARRIAELDTQDGAATETLTPDSLGG